MGEKSHIPTKEENTLRRNRFNAWNYIPTRFYKSHKERRNAMNFPYERQAMRGDPPPDGLDGADRLFYMQLVYLYKNYHNGVWTREQAKAVKQQFIREYAVSKSNAELFAQTVRMRNATDVELSRFYKEQTVENARRVFETWEGLRRSDARGEL